MTQLDSWQKEVIECKGNICLCSGRQVGKSFAISRKAAMYALNNPKKTIMVIASVERQAYLLLEKILSFLELNFKDNISQGYKKPTKHKVNLKNGSIIYCLPTGLTGYGIRGYTVDLLIADEAAFIPEEVWTAVTPMLAITRGTIVLLSTPHGTGSYFHRCFEPDSGFTKFHVSSEECPRKDQDFLDREKSRMTKLQYAQEYLGEFVDDLTQVFPDELIKEAMTLQRRVGIRKERKYYLGCDFAAMGSDQSTFEILDGTEDVMEQVENITTSKTHTTDSTNMIISLNNSYHFKKEYLDSGGLGIGIVDQLRLLDQHKRKIVEINNASRVYDLDSSGKEVIEKTKKLMKEHLYQNLKALMEQKKIKLLDDTEIFRSLKSIQYEHTESGRTIFFGNYSHITEGLIRAAWGVKDKSLNIYCY